MAPWKLRDSKLLVLGMHSLLCFLMCCSIPVMPHVEPRRLAETITWSEWLLEHIQVWHVTAVIMGTAVFICIFNWKYQGNDPEPDNLKILFGSLNITDFCNDVVVTFNAFFVRVWLGSASTMHLVSTVFVNSLLLQEFLKALRRKNKAYWQKDVKMGSDVVFTVVLLISHLGPRFIEVLFSHAFMMPQFSLPIDEYREELRDLTRGVIYESFIQVVLQVLQVLLSGVALTSVQNVNVYISIFTSLLMLSMDCLTFHNTRDLDGAVRGEPEQASSPPPLGHEQVPLVPRNERIVIKVERDDLTIPGPQFGRHQFEIVEGEAVDSALANGYVVEKVKVAFDYDLLGNPMPLTEFCKRHDGKKVNESWFVLGLPHERIKYPKDIHSPHYKMQCNCSGQEATSAFEEIEFAFGENQKSTCTLAAPLGSMSSGSMKFFFPDGVNLKLRNMVVTVYAVQV